jgi:hypothetical protein
MKVSVQITEDEVEGEYTSVDGLRVICDRCGHEVEARGTSGSSAKYAAVQLRAECPNGEDNFYDVDWWDL